MQPVEREVQPKQLLSEVEGLQQRKQGVVEAGEGAQLVVVQPG